MAEIRTFAFFLHSPVVLFSLTHSTRYQLFVICASFCQHLIINSGSVNLFIAICDYEEEKKRNAAEILHGLRGSALRASRVKKLKNKKKSEKYPTESIM